MKKKKYFDGGAMLGGVSDTLGVGTNVLGAATSGNPSSLVSTGVNMQLDKLKQLQDLAKLNNTGMLTGGQNIAAGLATATGLGSILNPLILGDAKDKLANMNQDSMDIQNRNNMLGYADGGMLTYFNGGFEHTDQNPLNVNSGIPQGVAPDGRMNTVEKGETKLEDFIFSDTLKVPKSLEGTRLPGKIANKTFAQASKILDKELKERPHDKIARETANDLLGELKMLNEEAVAGETLNNFAKGGSIHIDPSKKGTFTAQATKMGMGIQEAANHILNAPEGRYSPAMRKKANFARQFAHAYGGTLQHETNPWLQLDTKVSDFAQVTNDPYNRENVFYPNVEGMPPYDIAQPTGATGKRWSIEDELKYATTPEDRAAALYSFSKRPAGEWGYYANQEGQEIGANGVPVQDINGRFAGGVTPEHLAALYPNIAKQISPEGNLNWSDEQINKFQQLYNEANYDKMMELDPSNPTYSRIGGDWLRGKDLDTPAKRLPPPDLGKMSPMSPRLQAPPLDTSLMPVNKKMTVESQGTPPVNMKVPNLWPEAGLLSAAPYMGLKPVLADPTTMSTGYLKPQLVDEMSMRAGIDSANRGNIGALANVTGGSGAAQRAGLLGAGSNYMDATGNAFLQANQANNQARMAADQFNIQNQTGVAGNNMQALNQFELENKQLINNINAKKADEFSNAISDYVGNASKRRAVRELDNARAADIFNATGYAPTIPGTYMNITPGTSGIPKHALTWEEWNKSKNPNKLAENVNFCYGGMIKTKRRGLK